MAVEIPDFSTYSNEDLLAIADEQAQNYIDAYNALNVLTENPAADGIANFFSTLGAGIEIGVLRIESENARQYEAVVQIQDSGEQDKFDFAEAFCLEWFTRFYPSNSFTEFKFPELSQAIQYDGVGNITVVTI